MDPVKHTRFITLLVLFSIFVLGLFTGWTIHSIYEREYAEFSRYQMKQLKPNVLEDRVVHDLTARLKLTPNQIEEIRPVIARGIADMMALRKDSLEKMSEHRSRLTEEIKKHLSPEQQVELEKLRQEKEAELRE
jgi:hypothetical protein